MREKISRKGTEVARLDTLEGRFLERLFQKKKNETTVYGPIFESTVRPNERREVRCSTSNGAPTRRQLGFNFPRLL